MEITEIMLKSQKYGDLALDVMRYQPMSETYVCQLIADDNGDHDWLLVDKHNIEIEHGDEMYLYTDTADYVSGGNFVQPVNNEPKKTFKVTFEGTDYESIAKALKNMDDSDKRFTNWEDVATHYKFAGYKGEKDGRTIRRAKQQTLSVASRFNRRYNGKLSTKLVESGVPASTLPESLLAT